MLTAFFISLGWLPEILVGLNVIITIALPIVGIAFWGTITLSVWASPFRDEVDNRIYNFLALVFLFSGLIGLLTGLIAAVFIVVAAVTGILIVIAKQIKMVFF